MFDKKLLSTLLVFAGILLVIFTLRPLIPAFCLALVLIYVTNPLTNFFQKYMKRRFLATSASFLTVILSFLALSLILLGEVLSEAAHVAEYLQTQQLAADVNLFQKLSESQIIRNLLTENGMNYV